MMRPLRFTPWSGSPGVVGTVVIPPPGGGEDPLATQEQEFWVQCVATRLLPIVQSQVVDVEIVADAGAYSPLDEGGAVLWFDLQDAASYTLNGGSTAITQILNKISSVAWTTPVNDTPYEAAGLNGHPCLHPLVVGDRIQSTEAAVVAVLNCPNTAKPYTLYYVISPDVTDGVGGQVFAVGNSGVSSASTRVWGQNIAGNGKWGTTHTAPATTIGNALSAADCALGVQVHCWHSPGTTQSLHVNNGTADPNGTTLNPAYTPGTGPDQAALFCRPDLAPDSGWGGKFGEIWLFSAEHDAAARTRVHDYLAARWAT